MHPQLSLERNMDPELGTAWRTPELVQAETSRLLIVDMQQKLLPLIAEADRVIAACRQLIEGAKLFSVPIFATEQYPQGLGPTTPELKQLLPETISKDEFSSCPMLGWPTAAEDPDERYQAIVAGIESHVCVLQTALELQSMGYRVSVVADATASRRPADRDVAFLRLLTSGVTLMTAESVLFEWCQCSNRPEFKSLSRLIKERPI
jgi:nicotinamidase-related amidase